MSDARERLSRMPTTLRDRSDSRESNTWEKPPLEGPLTTGWQPVSPSRTQYRLFSLTVYRVCGAGPSAASSGRRGRSRPHKMHDISDGGQEHSSQRQGVPAVPPLSHPGGGTPIRQPQTVTRPLKGGVPAVPAEMQLFADVRAGVCVYARPRRVPKQPGQPGHPFGSPRIRHEERLTRGRECPTPGVGRPGTAGTPPAEVGR
jgi:hypothetical protein